MIFHTTDWHCDHRNILDYDKRPDANIEAMNKRVIDTTNQYVTENDTLVYHGDLCLPKYLKRDDEAGYIQRVQHFLDALRCKNIVFVCGNHDRTYIRKWGQQLPNWPLWDLFRQWQCDYCGTVYDGSRRFGVPASCMKKNCEGLYDGTARHPLYHIHPMGYEMRLLPKLCSEHGIPSEFEGTMVVCTHYSHRVWNKSHHGKRGDVGPSINLYGHSHGGLPGIRNSFDVAFNVWNRPLSIVEILSTLMPKHNKTEAGKAYFGHHEEEGKTFDRHDE